MSDTTLPEPLVPAEVDLRGLAYMPLLGAKLFGSDFDLEATDAEFRRGLLLWWAAWNQQPAASLPNSERAQAKLAGFEDEKSPNWRKVRARVLHGFVLCSDGRLYHPVLAEQALIAWEKRVEHDTKKEHENERKRRERDDRSRMFEQLRAAGVTPAWNTSTTDLRALVTEHVTRTGSGHVTRPVTRTGTAKKRNDGTVIQELHGGATAADATRAPAPCTPGEVGQALKRAGLSPTTFNLGDPVLLALLEQGATLAEFEGLGREAIDKGITRPWPWVLKTLQGRRADAAAVRLAPRATAPPPGRQTATDRRLANIAALTGKDCHHATPAPAPADTVDVDARVVD